MRLIFLPLLCTLTAAVGIIAAALQPAEDARAYFATNFYRSLVHHMQGGAAINRSFVISPGAIQKLLVVLYHAAAETELADRMLWDMRLKHIDSKRLLAKADLGDIMYLGFVDVIDMWQQQLEKLESPIAVEQVQHYFDNDFSNMTGKSKIQNYLVAPKNLKFSTEFKQFAADYFYTLPLDDDEDADAAVLVNDIQKKFDVVLNKSRSLNIFSAFNLYAHCQMEENFNVSNNEISAQGHFRYGEIKDLADRELSAKVLELNLRAGLQPLSMLIVLPERAKDLDTFVTQILGRAVNNFDIVSRDLQLEKVDVSLPLLKFETITNLDSYFEQVSTRGLHDLFTQRIQLDAFETQPKSGIKVGSFWQKSVVQVDFVGVPKELEKNWTSTKIFDASDRSFFYVIKSDDVLYFMGHHFVYSNFYIDMKQVLKRLLKEQAQSAVTGNASQNNFRNVFMVIAVALVISLNYIFFI